VNAKKKKDEERKSIPISCSKKISASNVLVLDNKISDDSNTTSFSKQSDALKSDEFIKK